MVTVHAPNTATYYLCFTSQGTGLAYGPRRSGNAQLAVEIPTSGALTSYTTRQIGNQPEWPYEETWGHVRNENSVIHHKMNGDLYSNSKVEYPGYRIYNERVWDLLSSSASTGRLAVNMQSYTFLVLRPGEEITFTRDMHQGETVSARCYSCDAAEGVSACIVCTPRGYAYNWTLCVYVNGRARYRTNDRYGIDPESYFVSYEEAMSLMGGREAVEGHAKNGWLTSTFFTEAERIVREIGPWVGAMFTQQSSFDVWGELALRCTEGYKHTDVNVASNVLEGMELASGVKDLIDTGRSVAEAGLRTVERANFIPYAKAISNLYLALKWGVALTAQDFHTLQQDVDASLNAIRSGRADNPISVQHATMSYTAPGKALCTGMSISVQCWLKTLCRLSRTGVEHSLSRWAADYGVLSLENAWDMVPYSFVVDWLTDFSKIVKSADAINYRVSFLDVIGSVRGTKYTVDIPASLIEHFDTRFTGHLQYTQYYRIATTTLPLPALGFLHPSVGVDQWVDGTSLAIQRLE